MKKLKEPKLNLQAISRRDKGLMSCMISDPGMVVVGIDLVAAEPSVTANFSKDPNYRWATVDGVGKAPFYNADGVLMIDDMYLQVMSVSPLGADKMREAFNRDWDGKTFSEQWLIDSEVVKSALKKDRQVHKILCLGLSYGMSPKKMVKSMYDAGHQISYQQAKDFHEAYWRLYRGVERFSKQLAKQLTIDGYIINPFGYRLTPEPRLGFNFFIQSSVSGIMHVYSAKLFAAAPYAQFLTIIHDEIVAEVPEGRVEEFRVAAQRATDSLNEDLKWDVPVRTGFVFGGSWFEAK
jgi:DNA polymerase I-like protein with 3'-5' exonuclease and polymerase domains